MMSAGTQRLFFALWPDDGVRRALAREAKRQAQANARRVTPEAYHLTLAYMGASTVEQRVCYEAVGERLNLGGFELVLRRWAVFRKAAVAVVEPTADFPEELSALHRQLNDALSEKCGFTPDSREFHPHLTLWRKFTHDLSGEQLSPVCWRVRQLALLESISAPGGAQYHPQRIWEMT